MIFRRLAIPVALLIVAGAALGWAWFTARSSVSAIDPEDRFSAGLVAAAQNDLDTVRNAADALQDEPGYADHARVLRAMRLLKLRDPAGAVRELASEPVSEPLRLRASLILANAFYGLGNLAEAEQAALNAVRIDPRSADAHRLLAVMYYDLGANAAAIRELKLLASKDDDFRPHHLLGQILFDSEQYPAATAEFQAALKRDPPQSRRSEIVLYLARSLLKTHRYRQAADLLSPISRGHAPLLALASEAHAALGDQDQARRLLEQAERLDADDRFVLIQKARLAIQDRRFQAAVAPLERRLVVDPHDMECRYQLALCFQKLGKLKRYAVESARLKESQDLKEELARKSEEAVRNPRDAEVRDRIAVLFEKIGRPKIAAFYRRAAAECRRFSGKAAATRNTPHVRGGASPK